MTDLLNNTPTGIEAEVCADIAARQAVGIRKYGVTLEENDASMKECLDQACYLKWAMKACYGDSSSRASEAPVTRPDGETMP